MNNLSIQNVHNIQTLNTHLSPFNALSVPNLNALQRRAIQLRHYNEWQQKEREEREDNTHNSDNSDEKKTQKQIIKFSRQTQFMSAVKENDFDELRKLLREMRSNGESINGVKLSDGTTAIHQMCVEGNVGMLQWIVIDNNSDVNVNVCDNERWTPLHVICANATNVTNAIEMIQILLSNGANANAITSDGELAIDLLMANCNGNGNESEVNENVMRSELRRAERILLDAMREQRKEKREDEERDDECDGKENRDESDENDERLIREMREQELFAIERDLREWRAKGTMKVNDSNDDVTGATVIHVCAAKGYKQMLETILREFGHECDLEARDNDGWSALHAAAYWSQCECFDVLVSFGANIDAKVKVSNGRGESETESESECGMSALELSGENATIAAIVENRRRQQMRQKSEMEMEMQNRQQNDNNVNNVNVMRQLSLESMSSLVSADARLNSSSELQRKVNAKKARESRRSTSGVASEDVEKAKRLIEVTNTNREDDKKLQKENNNNNGNETTTEDDNITETIKANNENNINNNNSNNDNEETILTANLRRRRPDVRKRRSTGIADTDDITINNESVSVSVSPSADGVELVSSDVSRSRSTSRQSSFNSVGGDQLSTATTDSEMSTDDNQKDYKKLYEQLSVEYANCERECERIRAQLSTCEESERRREQEMQRERRKFDRRLSELEEELRAFNDVKAENVRLKDENSALIRVISKLSK